MGKLVTYGRVEDLVFNAPAGQVAMVLLDNDDEPPMIRRTLRWLRHRWDRCAMYVIGQDEATERSAREGGASFLVRPVEDGVLAAVLGEALRGRPTKVEQASGVRRGDG